MVCDQGRESRTYFFGAVDIQQKEKAQTFELMRRPHSQFPHLVGQAGFP